MSTTYKISRKAFTAWVRRQPKGKTWDLNYSRRCVVTDYLGRNSTVDRMPAWLRTIVLGGLAGELTREQLLAQLEKK